MAPRIPFLGAPVLPNVPTLSMASPGTVRPESTLAPNRPLVAAHQKPLVLTPNYMSVLAAKTPSAMAPRMPSLGAPLIQSDPTKSMASPGTARLESIFSPHSPSVSAPQKLLLTYAKLSVSNSSDCSISYVTNNSLFWHSCITKCSNHSSSKPKYCAS